MNSSLFKTKVIKRSSTLQSIPIAISIKSEDECSTKFLKLTLCLFTYYWASFSTQIILHCTPIEAGDFSPWWSLEVFREGFSNCCFATPFGDCRFVWVFSLRNSIRLLMVGRPEGLLPLSSFIFSNFHMLPEFIDTDLKPIKQLFLSFFPSRFLKLIISVV